MAGSKARIALSSAGFTVSLAAQRGLPFLALPVVARALSQDDFGAATLCVSIAAVLAVAMNLGVASTIPRLFHAPPDGAGPGSWVALLITQLAAASLVAGLGLGVAAAIARYDGSLALLVAGTVALAWAQSTQQSMQGIAVARGTPGRLAVATLAQLGVGLGLISVLARAHGPAGYLLSLAAASAVACAILAPGRYPRADWERRGLAASMRLSWPFIGQGLSTWLISLFDRIAIGAIIGTALLGQYQTAYMVGSALGVVLEGTQAAWAPRYYRSRSPGKAVRLSAVMPASRWLAGCLVVALVTLIPLMFGVIAPSYQLDLMVVSLIAACAVPRSSYFIAVAALLDRGRSVTIMTSTLLSGVLAAAGALALAGPLGIVGGGISTLVAFVLQSAIVVSAAFDRPMAREALWAALWATASFLAAVAAIAVTAARPVLAIAVGVAALIGALVASRDMLARLHLAIGDTTSVMDQAQRKE